MDTNLVLARASFPELIANKLEEMIIDGKFTMEQRLPSEQSLANDFGVSRPVVREAMKILKERGLIIQKNGEGTFICEPDSELVTETINRIVHLKKIDVSDIFSVRINLETMAAAQAVQNASEEGFDELQAINDQMRRNKDDVEKRTQDDVLFHRKIAQLSGNLLLEVFVESMASLVTKVVKYTLDYKVGNEEGIDYHDRIIQVLRSRNIAEARKVLRLHLESSQRNYILAVSQEEKKREDMGES
ncbi:MAG: FadR family transcriptional regulator [Lachnospiraceae bacterium]|nr:FadR family transcriptional regulator [Lachnospiraceae bacterium]